VDFKGRLIFDVQKINKRLHIVLRESYKLMPLKGFRKYLKPKGPTIVYTPPDFIREKFPSRDDMQLLADGLNTCEPAKDRILVLMLWEEKMLQKKGRSNGITRFPERGNGVGPQIGRR
jgi:hypothetical protein